MKTLSPNLPPRNLPNSTSGAVVDYAADPATTRVLDACERGIVWRPDDGEPESLRLPSAAERGLLEQRRRELAAAATPCSLDSERRRAAAAIADMLDGFLRARSIDVAAKQAMIAGILTDLAALPAWAIERACERVRRGEFDGNPDFVPTSPRLYRLASAELVPLRLEEQRIAATLRLLPRSAPPDDDDGRQRIASGLQALSAKLAEPSEQEIERRRQRSERMRAESIARTQREWGDQPAPTIAGVPISRELAGMLTARQGEEGKGP